MSESFIEPEPLNTTFQNLSAIVDADGSTKFLNPELSSYNFDGFIPLSSSSIKVNQLKPGMLFLPVGASVGSLRAALKVEFDDPEMTDSPTADYIISYLGQNGDIETIVYDSNSDIDVYFEDWDSKVLGSTGWTITQAGNAIFSNVAVRGRIEATEGLIDGDLTVTGSLSTSETADTTGGIVFDSDGIFAYNTSGTQTFSLDSATGDVTIFGTPGNDLLIGSDISDTGTTIISANRITTGSVTGRVFRSNSTMTPTSGTGIYLDGDNNVRFSDPDATFTFNNSGLNITSTNATMTFNSTGLSISGAGVTIGGTVKIDGENASSLLTGTDVGPSGTTTISGDRITTGSIESSAPDFQWDGISTFSTQGTKFSVNDGQIISENFRIDSAGNAYFGGNLTAGISITSPTITGGIFQTNSSGQRIVINSSSQNEIDFYSGLTQEIYNGYIRVNTVLSAPRARGVIEIVAPGTVNGATARQPKIFMLSDLGDGTATPPSGGSQGLVQIACPQIYFTGESDTAFSGQSANIQMNGTLQVNSTITSFSTITGDSFIGNGSGITSLNGTNISSGTVAAGRIADLSAGKITSGTFDDARIPNLAASKITSGVFAAARIENVSPSTFSNAQTALQIRTSDNRVGIVGSTLNIKENILPLTGIQSGVVPEEKNALGKINLLIDPNKIFEVTPVEYSIVGENPGIKEIGFIVEDLLEKWPAAVSYDKDGKPQSYNTNSIVAGLVYAVQILKNRVEELEEKINNG